MGDGVCLWVGGLDGGGEEGVGLPDEVGVGLVEGDLRLVLEAGGVPDQPGVLPVLAVEHLQAVVLKEGDSGE